MNEFLKMDIFFVIATAAVAVGTCAVALVTWRFLRILKHIEHVSEQVALESDDIRADLALVRADISRGKGRLKSLFSFFGTRVRKASKRT